MINPLAALRLPKQGLSPQAMLTVAVVHVLVFWWALNGEKAVQATRQVVYQTFSPITMPREKTPAPVAPQAAVVKTPATLTRPKPTEPVQSAPAQPPAVVQRLESLTPPRATFQVKELTSTAQAKKSHEIPSSQLAPLAALPEPVVVEQSLPAPPQVAIPLPVAPFSPNVPLPELSKLPQKLPMPLEPVAASPSPAPAIAESPPPTSASTVPGATRSSAITPSELRAPVASSGSGAAAGSSFSVTPAGGAVPGGIGTNYGIPGGGRQRQRSLSEMANEQLNPGGRKDSLAAAVEASQRPDCVNSGQAAGILAPAIVAYNVVRDKCK